MSFGQRLFRRQALRRSDVILLLCFVLSMSSYGAPDDTFCNGSKKKLFYQDIMPRANPTNHVAEMRSYYAYHAPEHDYMIFHGSLLSPGGANIASEVSMYSCLFSKDLAYSSWRPTVRSLITDNERTGVIHTPNFPRRFPLPFRCSFIVVNQPSSYVVFTLTQMYLTGGVELVEYQSISNDTLQSKEYKMIPLGHSRLKKELPTGVKSSFAFPAIEVDVKSLTNTNIRVFDNLLDVYGFNITYEIVSEKDQTRRNKTCVHPYSCSYNGHCLASADFSKYTCSCFPGYRGDRCEMGSQCNPERGINPCQNGGTCSYAVGALRNSCTCRTGFDGALCENNVSENIPVKVSSGIVCSVGLVGNKTDLASVAYELKDTIETASANMFTIGYFQSRGGGSAIFHILFNNTQTSSSVGRTRYETPKFSFLAPSVTEKSDQGTCGRFNETYVQDSIRLLHHFHHVLRIGSDDNSSYNLITSANLTLDALTQKVELKIERYAGPLGCIFEKPMNTTVNIPELKSVTVENSSCNFNFSASFNLTTSNKLTASKGFIMEGSSFQLTCRAPYTPNRKFVWTKYDGKNISVINSVRRMSINLTAADIDGCFSSSLEIKRSTRHDSGVYECKVEDCLVPRGEEMKKKIFLRIGVKPRSYLLPQSASVQKGSNLTISCFNAEKLELRSDADFTWFKDGVRLDGSEGEVIEDLVAGGSVLFVSRIEQSASYTCRVNNSIGRDSSELIVTILGNVSCPSDVHSSVTWSLTAAGATDVQRCPSGYLGQVTRQCKLIELTYDDGRIEANGEWADPVFSKCINSSLSLDVITFVQHAIGYGKYEPEAILKKMVNTLQLVTNKDNITDLHSGGGEMFLAAVAAIQDYCWRKETMLIKPYPNELFEVLARLMSRPTNIVSPQAFHLLIRVLEDQVSLRAARINGSLAEKFDERGLNISMEKSSPDKVVYVVESPVDDCLQPHSVSVLQRAYISSSIAYPDLDVKRFKHNGTFKNKNQSVRLLPASFLNTTIQRNDYPFQPPHSHWSFLHANLPYSLPSSYPTIKSSVDSKNADSFIVIVRLSVGYLRRSPSYSYGCGILNGATRNDLLWDMENCSKPLFEGGIAKCVCNSSGTFMLFQFKSSELADSHSDAKHWAALFVGALAAMVLLGLSLVALFLALLRAPTIIMALKAQFCVSAFGLMIFSEQSYSSVDSQVIMYPVSDVLVNFLSSLCAATQLGIAVILFLELLEIARAVDPSLQVRLRTHVFVIPASWGISLFVVCIYISVWSVSPPSQVWTAAGPQFVFGCLVVLLWLTAGFGIISYLRWMIKRVELSPKSRNDMNRECLSVILLLAATLLFKAWRLFWLALTKLPVCLIFSLVCILMGMATFTMYLILNFDVHTCFRWSFKSVATGEEPPVAEDEVDAQDADVSASAAKQQSKPQGSQRPRQATLPLLLRAGLGPEVQAAFESSSSGDVGQAQFPPRSKLKRETSNSMNCPSAKTELTTLSRTENNSGSAGTLFDVCDPTPDTDDAPKAPHNTPSFLPDPCKSLWILDWQMATKAWHAVSAFRSRSVTMSSDRDMNSADVEVASPESSTEFRAQLAPRQRHESSSSGISCRKQSVSSGSNKAGPSGAPRVQKRPVFIKWRDPELGAPLTNNNYNSSSSSSGERGIVRPYPGKCYLRCSPEKVPKKKPARNRVKAIDCGVQTSKELFNTFASENETIVEAVIEKTPADEYVAMDPAGSFAVMAVPLAPTAFPETGFSEEELDQTVMC